MSYIRKGIFGAIAITVVSGAAQIAFGEDLTVGIRSGDAAISEPGVNRIVKADRAPVFRESVAPTQTISIHVDKVPETSVLVRIPATREAQGSFAPAPLQAKDDRKMSVACEPVVSVLTEIAKRLQPGRCVT